MSWPTAQLNSLNLLLEDIWTRNPFFETKWSQAGLKPRRITSLAELEEFPLLSRAELLEDQTRKPLLGSNLSVPLSDCHRFHRSSGTTSNPIHWADDSASWDWIGRSSQSLFSISGVQPRDRVCLALSFGAASGPWIICEGLRLLGASFFSADPADPEPLLRAAAAFQPTVLLGRPSRLLALGQSLGRGHCPSELPSVKKLILSGEYSPAARPQLERVWTAECFDRYGMTEAGSIAAECPAHSGGMHLLFQSLIAESIDPDSLEPTRPGERGELLLTTLGRRARPILRYRTGDLVRLLPEFNCPCGRGGPFLSGGVRRIIP